LIDLVRLSAGRCLNGGVRRYFVTDSVPMSAFNGDCGTELHRGDHLIGGGLVISDQHRQDLAPAEIAQTHFLAEVE
jgi:hypothetical protein